MQKFWFDTKRSGLDFIAPRVKHGYLGIWQPLEDYYKIAYNLAHPFFNGGETDIEMCLGGTV